MAREQKIQIRAQMRDRHPNRRKLPLQVKLYLCSMDFQEARAHLDVDYSMGGIDRCIGESSKASANVATETGANILVRIAERTLAAACATPPEPLVNNNGSSGN